MDLEPMITRLHHTENNFLLLKNVFNANADNIANFIMTAKKSIMCSKVNGWIKSQYKYP